MLSAALFWPALISFTGRYGVLVVTPSRAPAAPLACARGDRDSKEALAAAFTKFEAKYAELQRRRREGITELQDDDDDVYSDSKEALAAAFRKFEASYAKLEQQRQTAGSSAIDAEQAALRRAFRKFEAGYEELKRQREVEEAAAMALANSQDFSELPQWERGVGPCRLFVGGIPFGMTESEVARLFDGVALPHEISPVLEVSLVLATDGSPRGYGFVELATEVQAERAKKLLHGRAIHHGGRMPTTLVVRAAQPRTASRSPELIPPPSAGRLLWVGNVSWDVRPVELRDAFASAARIDPEAGVWCQMPRDGAGRMKGFATVKFPDSTYATRALEAMNGAELKGRELLVKYDFRAGPVHASAAVQPRPCSHAAILRPVQPTPCRPPRALREPHALVRPAPPSTAPRAAD